MKIGITTFHCSYNYGSVLQAYALQTYLLKQGNEVKIIDYVMKRDFEQYKLFRTNLYKNNIKSLFADIAYYLPNYKRKREFERFIHEHLKLTNDQYTNINQMNGLNDEFDVFICGSDQIWNFDCTGGVEPVYFLQFVDEQKIKISYAPSIAHVNFNENNQELLRKYLSKFDAISIREESTLPVVESLTEKRIVVTLDPTLLLDISDYNKLLGEFKHYDKYIFVYMLERNSDLLLYAEYLSEKYNLTILYISKKKVRQFKKSKNVYGTSPEMFLSYIKNAEFVITNSFHATVFSIQFQKQFCTFGTLKSSSRMNDLLIKLELSNRLFHDEFMIEEKINYVKSKILLDELRSSSMEFIDQAVFIERKNNE